MYALSWVSSGSGKGLLHAQCYDITWINAEALSIGPLWTVEFNNFFDQQNAFASVVWFYESLFAHIL